MMTVELPVLSGRLGSLPSTGLVLATAVLALMIHLALGWPWVVAAGVCGGFFAMRRGWLVGLAGVGLSWTVLIIYGLVVAAGPTQEMLRVMGALIGNITSPGVVALTLLIGCALGGLGGGIGTQLAAMVRRRG